MKMQLHKLAITICPISNTTVYPVYQTCHHHPKNPLNITRTFSLWADCSVSWSPSTKNLSRTTLPLSFFNCGTYLDGTDIRCWDISPQMLVLRIPNQENTRKNSGSNSMSPNNIVMCRTFPAWFDGYGWHIHFCKELICLPWKNVYSPELFSFSHWILWFHLVTDQTMIDFDYAHHLKAKFQFLLQYYYIICFLPQKLFR